MKIKTILIIVIFILILTVGFLTLSDNNITQKKTVKVGDADFTLPNGYYRGNLNEDGSENITNGKNSIFLSSYKNNNISKYIWSYRDYKLKENKTSTVTNFTVDNTTIFKLTVTNEPWNIHYWFVKGEKVYSIYCWDGNANMDNLVTDLIKSMKV